MRRDLVAIIVATLLAAACSAQEPQIKWQASCAGAWTVDHLGRQYCSIGDLDAIKRQIEEWNRAAQPFTPPGPPRWETLAGAMQCNGSCTGFGKAQEPITITPGPTTIAAPGLKVYTTFLGLPCGPEFPMPGCLPAEMQGWLVQIEGGAEHEAFDVTLVYVDAANRRHLHTQECVQRAEPFQGKPPFTAIPFAVGRAKSPPWFSTGTTVVRTEVWPSKPGCHERP